MKISLKLINFYQKYLSKLKPPSCRFYPTCSAYAHICFDLMPPHIAFFKSLKRIMSCHPFSNKYWDYPIISFHTSSLLIKKNNNKFIKYYLIPIENFKIIKSNIIIKCHIIKNLVS